MTFFHFFWKLLTLSEFRAKRCQKLCYKTWLLRTKLCAATIVYVLLQSPEAAGKQQISELKVFPTYVTRDLRISSAFFMLVRSEQSIISTKKVFLNINDFVCALKLLKLRGDAHPSRMRDGTEF